MSSPIRAAVLTISDAAAGGRRADSSGPALEEALERLCGASVTARAVLPDDPEEIQIQLRRWCADGLELVATTGGTGVSPRDRTPEAVRAVVEFEVPGLAELMRARTGREFPPAYLSRSVAGVCGRTLILALPGSPRGAVDCLAAVAELVPHAIEVIRGEPGHP